MVSAPKKAASFQLLSYIKEVSIRVKSLHQKAEVNITNELFSEFKDLLNRANSMTFDTSL